MPSNNSIMPIACLFTATVALSALIPVTSANATHRFHAGTAFAVGAIGATVGVIVNGINHHRYRNANNIYYGQPVYIPPLPVIQVPRTYYPTVRRGAYLPSPFLGGYVHPYPARAYKKAKRIRPVYRKSNAAPKVIKFNSAYNKSGAYAPWSAGWKSYCRAKFKSFNAKSGTYMGYDGRRHFCVAR